MFSRSNKNQPYNTQKINSFFFRMPSFFHARISPFDSTKSESTSSITQDFISTSLSSSELETSIIKNNDGHFFGVYVSHHKNSLILRTLIRTFNKNQTYLRAFFDNGTYLIENCNIVKQSLEGYAVDFSLSEPLSLQELISIVELLNTSNYPVALYSDANLGTHKHPNVTWVFHTLVETLKPTYLFPFTATALCEQDAIRYLKSDITTEGYKLLLHKPLGVASLSANINSNVTSFLKTLNCDTASMTI